METPAHPSKPTPLGAMSALAAGYLALAILGQRLSFQPDQISPVWLPAGLSFFALVRWGDRLWPGVLLGAVASNRFALPLGECLLGLGPAVPRGLLPSFVIAAGSTASALLGSHLFRELRVPVQLEAPRGVWSLAAIVAPLSVLPSVLIGTTTLAMSGAAPGATFVSVALTWWSGDLIGVLIGGAFLPRAAVAPSTREGALLAALSAAAPIVVFLGFDGRAAMPAVWLCLVAPTWAALRFDPPLPARAIGLLALAAVLGSSLGHGPFGDFRTGGVALVSLQALLAFATVWTLLLSAVVQAQRRTMAALAASEERHRRIGEHARDVICMHGLDGRFSYLSPSISKIAGWDPEELLGCDPFDYVHPDDVEPLRAAHARVTASPEGGALTQFRFRRREGGWVWIEASGQLFRDEGGAPLGILTVCRDISRQHEDELRLRLATEAARIGIWDIDLRRDRVTVAGQFVEIWGTRPDPNESARAWWQAHVHPEDFGRIAAAIDACANLGAPVDEPFRALTHAGERIVALRCVALRDDEGKAARLIGINWDITDRTSAEADLAALRTRLALREEQLRLALESSAVGMWDWSLCDGRVDFSDSWLEMLGYQRSELAPHLESWQRLLHPDDVATIEAAVQAHIDGRSPLYRTEHRLKHKDGSWIWILDSGRIVRRAEDGRALRMIGTYVDITSLKRTEAALVEARREAEAAARAKSEFLATMSHEIRTPMNGVLGMASVLLETPLPSGQREMVETIRSSGEALLQILNDILDLSKVEAGRLTLEPRAVDAAHAARDVLALFAAQAAAKGLALRLEADAHVALPPVRADAGRLRQVLLNLVGNAIKFTDRGEVTVTLARAPGAGGAADEQLAIAVRDSGVGVVAERLPGLFERFSHGAGPAERRFGGAGLGLSISKSLVEAMGGTIVVESAIGVGSVFTVRLPCCAPTLIAPAAEPPAPARRFDGRRVLVVEDNPVNQRVACAMLDQFAVASDLAADGLEGLAALERQRFDLVLMDCQLPVMDGLEATRRWRTREAAEGRPRVPIVAMTANAFPQDRARCLESGMDDVIAKPMTRNGLAGVLARWLVGAADGRQDAR